jgi:hypothetical protein
MTRRKHTETAMMTAGANHERANHERANAVTQPNMPPPTDLTPGFYPDSQGVMRLWDGQRWTEVTRPMPQPATPPAGQPGYYPVAQGVMRWWTGRDWAPHTQPAATSQSEPRRRDKAETGLDSSHRDSRACFVWLSAPIGPGGAAAPAAVQASEDPEPEVEPSQPPTVGIGEKVRDDTYQFTVTRVTCGVKRVGSTYANEKAQGQFCLVRMRVKNVGKEPINFSDENQALVDTKGREYSPDDEAWIYIDEDPYAEINPGNTLKTTVPFDISKRTKPDYLLLKAGFWGFSDGVRVKL